MLASFTDIEGFDWDWANVEENIIKHGVLRQEVEEVFQDIDKCFYDDLKHSTQAETRFAVTGKSHSSRLLTIFFTVRRNKIRAISARDSSRKERQLYEEAFNSTKI